MTPASFVAGFVGLASAALPALGSTFRAAIDPTSPNVTRLLVGASNAGAIMGYFGAVSDTGSILLLGAALAGFTWILRRRRARS